MDTVEGLPPGWTVWWRRRKTGNRRDAYYTDPVNGYVFRSKKDAQRYIATGIPGIYAFIPSRGEASSEEQMVEKTTASFTANRQEVSGSLTGGHLSMGQYSESGEARKDESTPGSASLGGKRTNQLARLTFPHTKGSKKKKRRKGSIKKRSISPHLINVPSENQTVENGVDVLEPKKTEHRPRSRKCELYLNTPRRSKRLAGTSIELESQMVDANGVTPAGIVQSAPEAAPRVSSTSGSEAFIVPERFNQLELEKEGSSTINALTDKDLLQQEGYYVETQEQVNIVQTNKCEEPLKQEEHHLECEEPVSVSEGNKEVEPLEGCSSFVGTDEQTIEPGEPQANLADTTRIFEADEQADEKQENTLPLPFVESWLDPSVVFAYETLTGEIPVENHLEAAVPSAIPPLDDPCFQFAYKTLTGEISLEDLFQPAPTTTQIQSNAMEVASPDVSVDDYLLFDSIVQPASPPKSVPGSESILGSANQVVQHLGQKVADDTNENVDSNIGEGKSIG